MTQALNLGLLGNNVNTSGQVSLTAGVSGTLPMANGGLGTTTLTQNNVLLGNGGSSPQVVAPGTSGNVLTSNGSTWTSAAAPAPTTANVLAATAGASVGAVGTYAFMYDFNISSGASRAPGTTLAGTNLRYAGAPLLEGYTGDATTTPAVAGTWRLMGFSIGPYSLFCGTLIEARLSLWLRIS